ncbi:MAG: hypothetical protein JNJ40_02710 [Bacteroidia bacterium]|nr:hypothetical protein [Bacteroidia bacterium]
MLLDLKEFEQKIEEPELKKGLRLFEDNKLELLNKTANAFFNFLIYSKPGGEIFLQIKGGKIIKYNCFCVNKNYCSHLAAVIFYLQKEMFETIRPLQKSERSYAKKNQTENYINKLKYDLKPFVNINKLKTQDVNDILKRIDLEKENSIFFKQEFYFHLAIILELPKFPAFNYTDHDNKLHAQFKISEQKLKQLPAKKLTIKEKEAVIEAAKYSIRSQANFRAGVFSLLIAYACVIIKDQNELEFLKNQLKKRSLSKNRTEHLDRKLISELQLLITHSKFLHKKFSIKDYNSTIELPIALAELEFCKNKNEKGFEILIENAEVLKENKAKYLAMVEEIVNIAKEKKQSKIELEYLQEKFIYGFVIDENELNHFFELNKKNEDHVANELLQRLRTESPFYTFDKIAVLLINQNRLSELVEEIKKEKNKFRILNSISHKILPDNDFIKLYVKHLSQAITEARFPYFQQEILNLARTYIDKLSIEPRLILIKLLKEKMMYDRQFLVYLNKLYPDKL